VTWTNLLENKEAQKHKTSKKELDNMRALIARDLADAGIAGLSADRRFATAYNAALQAANMAIACAGYRIMSKVGHPRVSLESTNSSISWVGKCEMHRISNFKYIGRSAIVLVRRNPCRERFDSALSGKFR
jgi:hypothetical protein